MPEEGKAASGFLRGIDEGINPVAVDVIEVTVGKKGFHRTERNGENVRSQRCIVTVAGYTIKRNIPTSSQPT